MSDALLYTLGVLVFVVGLLASIGLHEVGHMVPAKRFGVKVTQYFVGFGKTVWSVKRGETEYGIKAIPLGGYVKLVGMLPPHRGEDPTKVRSTNTGMFTQLITDARNAEYEHVGPGEEDRLFYRKPWWQKLIVMSGGPLVNIAIAVFLFTVLLVGIGVPTPTTIASSVSDCVVLASEQGRTCTADDPVAPAKQAGLMAGDEIVSFNGTEVTSWDQVTDLIRANADGRATIDIVRDGQPMTLTADTTVTPRPSRTDPETLVDVGFLGVSPTVTYERQGVSAVPEVMWGYTLATGVAIAHLPDRMVGVFKAAFGAERAQNSPISVVGASRVAGEMVTTEESTWTSRVADLIGLLATVNLFVALFNFIPLLPLDGGHIAGALWEAIRRAIAKLRNRPDPGYVDVARMLPVAYAVGGVLMIMSVLLVYADIVNPISIN